MFTVKAFIRPYKAIQLINSDNNSCMCVQEISDSTHTEHLIFVKNSCPTQVVSQYLSCNKKGFPNNSINNYINEFLLLIRFCLFNIYIGLLSWDIIEKPLIIATQKIKNKLFLLLVWDTFFIS